MSLLRTGLGDLLNSRNCLLLSRLDISLYIVVLSSRNLRIIIHHNVMCCFDKVVNTYGLELRDMLVSQPSHTRLRPWEHRSCKEEGGIEYRQSLQRRRQRFFLSVNT